MEAMEKRRVRPRPMRKGSSGQGASAASRKAKRKEASGDPHIEAQERKVKREITKGGRAKEVDPTIRVSIPLRAGSKITLDSEDHAIVFIHAYGYEVRLLLNDDPMLFKKLADLISSARTELGVDAAVAEIVAERGAPTPSKEEEKQKKPTIIGVRGGPDIEQARKRLGERKQSWQQNE